MNVQEIEISKIIVPETRVTAVYDEALTKLLKSTMTAVGVVVPIVVVKVGDKYELVDGLHRLQESITQGKTTITARVVEGNERTTMMLNLVTNHTRGKTRASELVKVIGYSLQTLGMTLDEIAAEAGFPLDYLKKIARVATAVPRVLDLLDREVITVSHAYEISRLPRPEQQDELAAKMPLYRTPVKELHDYVNQVLQYMEEAARNSQASAPRATPEYRCEVCENVVDQRHLKPVMLCPDCFGIVYRENKAKQKPTAVEAPASVETVGS